MKRKNFDMRAVLVILAVYLSFKGKIIIFFINLMSHFVKMFIDAAAVVFLTCGMIFKNRLSVKVMN